MPQKFMKKEAEVRKPESEVGNGKDALEKGQNPQYVVRKKGVQECEGSFEKVCIWRNIRVFHFAVLSMRTLFIYVLGSL